MITPEGHVELVSAQLCSKDRLTLSMQDMHGMLRVRRRGVGIEKGRSRLDIEYLE